MNNKPNIIYKGNGTKIQSEPKYGLFDKFKFTTKKSSVDISHMKHYKKYQQTKVLFHDNLSEKNSKKNFLQEKKENLPPGILLETTNYSSLMNDNFHLFNHTNTSPKKHQQPLTQASLTCFTDVLNPSPDKNILTTDKDTDKKTIKIKQHKKRFIDPIDLSSNPNMRACLNKQLFSSRKKAMSKTITGRMTAVYNNHSIASIDSKDKSFIENIDNSKSYILPSITSFTVSPNENLQANSVNKKKSNKNLKSLTDNSFNFFYLGNSKNLNFPSLLMPPEKAVQIIKNTKVVIEGSNYSETSLNVPSYSLLSNGSMWKSASRSLENSLMSENEVIIDLCSDVSSDFCNENNIDDNSVNRLSQSESLFSNTRDSDFALKITEDDSNKLLDTITIEMKAENLKIQSTNENMILESFKESSFEESKHADNSQEKFTLSDIKNESNTPILLKSENDIIYTESCDDSAIIISSNESIILKEKTPEHEHSLHIKPSRFPLSPDEIISDSDSDDFEESVVFNKPIPNFNHNSRNDNENNRPSLFDEYCDFSNAIEQKKNDLDKIFPKDGTDVVLFNNENSGKKEIEGSEEQSYLSNEQLSDMTLIDLQNLIASWGLKPIKGGSEKIRTFIRSKLNLGVAEKEDSTTHSLHKLKKQKSTTVKKTSTEDKNEDQVKISIDENNADFNDKLTKLFINSSYFDQALLYQPINVNKFCKDFGFIGMDVSDDKLMDEKESDTDTDSISSEDDLQSGNTKNKRKRKGRIKKVSDRTMYSKVANWFVEKGILSTISKWDDSNRIKKNKKQAKSSTQEIKND